MIGDTCVLQKRKCLGSIFRKVRSSFHVVRIVITAPTSGQRPSSLGVGRGGLKNQLITKCDTGPRYKLTGPSEHCNERSGSIKGGVFLD
jgi:hypothetical protein